jgi:hypothetical protein
MVYYSDPHKPRAALLGLVSAHKFMLHEKLRRRYAWEAAQRAAAGQHADMSASPSSLDSFHVYQLLLLQLADVKENIEAHPEGDALYHSLQVFELARQLRPYDQEFLLAALLHDAGKGLDRREHVPATLAALDGHITPRTAWLIEHHCEALSLRNGVLGVRARRRLQASADFEELMLLADCDDAGRAVGMAVPDVPEALDYLRRLAHNCGE